MTPSKARVIANRVHKESKPCEVCGACKRVHRHHDNYNKPAEIRFLCPKCHSRWHKLNKAISDTSETIKQIFFVGNDIEMIKDIKILGLVTNRKMNDVIMDLIKIGLKEEQEKYKDLI